MPRTPAWQAEHGHPHTTRYPEHEHGDNPTEESLKLEHASLFPVMDWRETHPHVHEEYTSEHEHPEGQSEEEFEAQHIALDSFAQEPVTDFRHPQDPPTDPSADPPSTEDLTARGKPSNGAVAQTGFGDLVINVEDEEGVKFLALLDERSEIKALASRWNAIRLDIVKQLTARSLNNGSAVRIRVGAHILNLSDKSEAKAVDAKTREGSQRLSIVHPE